MVEHSRLAEVRLVLASNSCPFSALSQEVRESVAAVMDVRECKADDLLVRQGDQDDFLLVLITGLASACLGRADGDTIPIAEFTRGSLIGEISLLTSEARTADVVCQTPVCAALLSSDDFNHLAQQYPELFVLLTNVVGQRLGRSTYDGLSGKDVHGYHIDRCAGRGGMGIVYEATRLAGGARVALKMMNHRLLYQRQAILRFQREADALKSLRHGALARLYDRFAAYKTQFLVMEFCDGTPLSRLIRSRGPLAEGVVRKIVGQLADALEYVHDFELIHGDVKPSNVMLSNTGQVKLIDFGLVRSDRPRSVEGASRGSSPSSPTGFVAGTPRYMAPEQFALESWDNRVDWYGLACIAYEALTGGPVVDANELFAIIREQERFVLPPASEIGLGVSRQMHDFLDSGLKKRPEERAVDLNQLSRWADLVDLQALSVTDGEPGSQADTDM